MGKTATQAIRETASASRKSRRSWRRGQWIEGYLFMAPWLLGFFIWTLGPMLFSAGLVFSDLELLSPIPRAGLSNLNRPVGDELFVKALYNTPLFTLIRV